MRVGFFNAEDTKHSATRSRSPCFQFGGIWTCWFINSRSPFCSFQNLLVDVHCSTLSRTVVDAGGVDSRAQTCVITLSNIFSCHCQSILDHLSDPIGYLLRSWLAWYACWGIEACPFPEFFGKIDILFATDSVLGRRLYITVTFNFFRKVASILGLV